MGIFKESDGDDLDWHLLQNSPVHLYWKESVLKLHLDWLKDRFYLIYSLDCSTWSSEEGLHGEIARVYNFQIITGKT